MANLRFGSPAPCRQFHLLDLELLFLELPLPIAAGSLIHQLSKASFGVRLSLCKIMFQRQTEPFGLRRRELLPLLVFSASLLPFPTNRVQVGLRSEKTGEERRSFGFNEDRQIAARRVYPLGLLPGKFE